MAEKADKPAIAWEKTKAYRQLRDGLRDNLESRGLIEPQYRDMTEHYLALWVQRQKLEADIAQRGVTLWDEKRGMEVENRSVSLNVQVSRQMLNIYSALGFKDISSGAAKTPDQDDEL